MMKNIRLLTLAGLVVFALVLLAYPLISKTSGVIVTSVHRDSPCRETIIEGSVITDVSGIPIRNSNDFYRAVKGLEGTTTFIINGNPRSCEIPSGSTLNVTVKDVKKRILRFGVDIQGGKEIILKPEKDVSDTTLQRILDTLESRAKNYGLTNDRLQIKNDSIHVLFDPDDEAEIKKIVKQGIVEARFMESLPLTNETGELIVNNKRYAVIPEDGSVLVNESEHRVDEVFTLEGLEVKVNNITENTTTFSVKVFDDQDVTKVLAGKGFSRIMEQRGEYVFVFRVELSEKAGENFARATKGQEVMVSPSGESFLKNPLVIFLDDEPIVSMPIPQSDVGKEIRIMPVWGFERTRKEASYKMLRLTTALESGRLPVKLDVVETIDVPPQRKGLIDLVIRGVLIGLSVFLVVSFIRYRELKTVGLMASILASEFILILGIASSRLFTMIVLVSGIISAVTKGGLRGWSRYVTIALMFMISFGIVVNRWVLDLPSVVGLTMMVCMSVAQMIIVNEKFRVEESILKKHETTFRIIWNIGFIVSVVMTPVFFISGLRGLAVGTVVGVMISTTITKPVYAGLLERIIASGS